MRHHTFADKLCQTVSLKKIQIHTETVKSNEASSMEIAVKYVVNCYTIMSTPSYYGAVSNK